VSDSQLNVQRARALYESGALQQAQALYVKVLSSEPRHYECLHMLGVLAARMGDLAGAAELIGRAIAVDPERAPAYCNRGLVQERLGKLESALADYDKAVDLDPHFWGGYFNRARLQRSLSRLEEALASYDAAVAIHTRSPEAFTNRGEVLLALRRWDAAVQSCGHAIALDPHCAEAHFNRGLALRQLDRVDDALANFDEALAINPDFAAAHRARGAALLALERPDAALASLERALALDPRNADALCNRGAALAKLGRGDDAIKSFHAAIAEDPAHAEGHYNLGKLLQDKQHWQAALDRYDHALKLKPDHGAANLNRGVALESLGRWPEALASYDRAIAIDANLAEAYFNRGNLLERFKRPRAALESYERAMSINPLLGYLRGQRLHSKMQLCDWGGFESDLDDLSARVERGEAVCAPFAFLALSGSAALQRHAAEVWVRERCPCVGPRPAIDFPGHASGRGRAKHRDRHDRIKVGYFSADFRNHPVSALAAELFETHDRRRFEVIAFAFGPDKQDPMRSRLRAAFDRFIDVDRQPDADVALLARRMDIDIAVDLGGHTRNSRPGIFVSRAAPIQVNFLGYPGTLGAPFADYMVADHTIIPPVYRRHYTEKILFVPSYQPNDSTRRISERALDRATHDLPPEGFVFCCFNSSYKITPPVFDVWMRILKQVTGSALWMRSADPDCIANLEREAHARGIAPNRLKFAPRLEAMEDHLARYRLADLFLDTWPFGAHTTAGDALWAGLPVLTCAGESFASRVGASLLTSIGLTELITANFENYEAAAIALAADRQRLADLRRRLDGQRHTAPLFDVRAYTEHLESGYRAMLDRYQAGLPPEDIHIGSGAPKED
jgi:predicted O-linked N-acetylglucosamine transferase (SPINDLY family)